MAADSWNTCPKCHSLRVAEREREWDHLRKQYGKIDPDEFVRLTTKLRESPDPDFDSEDNQSLREDYELGINEDGEFWV